MPAGVGRAPGAGVVADSGPFDLHHIRAEVTQQHRRVGGGQHATEVRDQQPGQCAGLLGAHDGSKLRTGRAVTRRFAVGHVRAGSDRGPARNAVVVDTVAPEGLWGMGFQTGARAMNRRSHG